MSWAGAYRRLVTALEPFAGYILQRRVKSGKEDETRIGERKGIASIARPPGTLIWMHGASVGETSMLLPLVRRLLDDDPKLHILITSGTMTSAKVMAERLPNRAFHQMVPLDGPNFVDRFLAHWQPNLAVWAESEIWPNLVLQTKASHARMALINARMNQNSIDRWRNKRNFARQVFSSFDVILPADTLTHNALKFLGGNVVSQIGNLKTAAPALEFDSAESKRLKKAIGRRPVWLAASTHGPEEAEILKAHMSGPDQKANALLLWVPRHPERGEEIAELCAGTDIAVRSNGEPVSPDTSIYIMDTLGEMGLALDLADVAFVGGSLHYSLTGHNPLEPARAQVPILTGPHVGSFTELYAELFNHNAAMRVTSAKQLEKSVMAMMTDPAAARQMAGRAKLLAEESDSVLAYTVARLRALL
ncbi:MAG: 3-deoxy-D-manno-octulosonic acid transferase [Litorimonas sp.]